MILELDGKTEKKSILSWLMTTITNIIEKNERKTKQHLYVFENMEKAAKVKTKLLKRNRHDYEKSMEKERGMMLEAGSEFRPAHIFEILFDKHVI